MKSGRGETKEDVSHRNTNVQAAKNKNCNPGGNYDTPLCRSVLVALSTLLNGDGTSEVEQAGVRERVACSRRQRRPRIHRSLLCGSGSVSVRQKI